MEPADRTLITRYAIYSKVIKITKMDSGRWYAHFEGSWEFICLGSDEPDMKAGDKIKITIERIVDAKSEPTPV